MERALLLQLPARDGASMSMAMSGPVGGGRAETQNLTYAYENVKRSHSILNIFKNLTHFLVIWQNFKFFNSMIEWIFD